MQEIIKYALKLLSYIFFLISATLFLCYYKYLAGSSFHHSFATPTYKIDFLRAFLINPVPRRLFAPKKPHLKSGHPLA